MKKINKEEIDIDVLFKAYNSSLPEPDSDNLNDSEMVNFILKKSKAKKNKSFFSKIIFELKLKIDSLKNSLTDLRSFYLYTSLSTACVLIITISFIYNQKNDVPNNIALKKVEKNSPIPAVSDLSKTDKKNGNNSKIETSSDPKNNLSKTIKIEVPQMSFGSSSINEESIILSQKILKNNTIPYKNVLKNYVIATQGKDTLSVKADVNLIIIKLSNNGNNELNKIAIEIEKSIKETIK